MNEQQLAAVKQALGALKKGTGWMEHGEIITALQSIISQDALHKMAEESRTSGLRLDDWDKIGCVNHDCDKCKAVQEPVAQDVQEKCRIETVPAKGGLLPTQPAPQPVPVQEPVAWQIRIGDSDDWSWLDSEEAADFYGKQSGLRYEKRPLYTAPQPVPVKTYHDGKPWPVAPKPWVGLDSLEVSDLWLDTPFDDCTEETFEAGRAFVEAIEAKLKEKNHDH